MEFWVAARSARNLGTAQALLGLPRVPEQVAFWRRAIGVQQFRRANSGCRARGRTMVVSWPCAASFSEYEVQGSPWTVTKLAPLGSASVHSLALGGTIPRLTLALWPTRSRSC